jgi:hypothetical protein
MSRLTTIGLVAAPLAALLFCVGCNGGPAPATEIPEPISLSLPRAVSIHPFTGLRRFDEAGGIRGIDVQIEMSDSFGDSTRGFGDFRFELYTYQPGTPDPKGQRVATWNESLMEAEKNALHWDRIKRLYEFRLQWDRPIPVGREFVLVAVFDSPYTPRLFDERVFVAGQ